MSLSLSPLATHSILFGLLVLAAVGLFVLLRRSPGGVK